MNKNEPLNIIGIITARGGSRRLPHKNIRYLNGEPLIAYIINAAQKSKYLKKVIVSTDHPAIRKIALRYGAEVPFKRPKIISGNCDSALVTQHAVKFIEKEQRRPVDIAVTLQPTSPFCKSSDIDSCIGMLLKNKFVGSVFSAVEIRKRPEWIFKLTKGNRAVAYIPNKLKSRGMTSKSSTKLITPNGGVYATKRQALFNENALISQKTLAYLMPLERSIDIDYKFDLIIAEFLLKNKIICKDNYRNVR